MHGFAGKMAVLFEDTWAKHGFQSAQPSPANTSTGISGCSSTGTPKKVEMYNKVVKVEGDTAEASEGEEASPHAPYYFVLHYVPDLHWCHLAPMRQDGVFPEVSRLGMPHQHAGKKRWRLMPEGQSKELDVSAARCIIVKRYLLSAC